MDETALLSSRLCLSLMRLGTRMASGFDGHFQPLGLTQAQFRLLLTVWEQGGPAGISPSQLAEHLLIERSSVSTLTQLLVRRGLLARQPGANRRSYLLVLTAEGQQVLQRAIPGAVFLADYILSELGPQELVQLRTLLGSVEERLRDYDPPPHPEVNP